MTQFDSFFVTYAHVWAYYARKIKKDKKSTWISIDNMIKLKGYRIKPVADQQKDKKNKKICWQVIIDILLWIGCVKTRGGTDTDLWKLDRNEINKKQRQ